MFLMKEKDTTTKVLDDDEWIRSLAEAQEITADIPEERITHDQSEVDLGKVRPIQMEECLRKCLQASGNISAFFSSGLA